MVSTSIGRSPLVFRVLPQNMPTSVVGLTPSQLCGSFVKPSIVHFVGRSAQHHTMSHGTRRNHDIYLASNAIWVGVGPRCLFEQALAVADKGSGGIIVTIRFKHGRGYSEVS